MDENAKKRGENRRISFDTWKRSKKFNFDERFREKGSGLLLPDHERSYSTR